MLFNPSCHESRELLNLAESLLNRARATETTCAPRQSSCENLATCMLLLELLRLYTSDSRVICSRRSRCQDHPRRRRKSSLRRSTATNVKKLDEQDLYCRSRIPTQTARRREVKHLKVLLNAPCSFETLNSAADSCSSHMLPLAASRHRIAIIIIYLTASKEFQ